MLADINGNLADLRSEAAMASQRFCLRWNNHQSNLLSVFDQLLHDESFVDVTLAVEGQLLRAHKMVLSACSPYFQALFVGHPDKHPIVILKDVPYVDMRSLLDFMYRGEVSVDQDRLTAFLRVAESLRIKGLTEVNEDKCELPSITSSILGNQNAVPPPPPNLHRINQLGHHLGQKRYHHMSSHPLLGSALTAPKRKRGRPRKLSGSSDTTPMDGLSDHGGAGDHLVQGSPEMMEMKMGLDFHSEVAAVASSATPAHNSSAGSSSSIASNGNHDRAKRDQEPTENGTDQGDLIVRIKGELEPTPSTSAQAKDEAFTRPLSRQGSESFKQEFSQTSASSNSSVKSDTSEKSRGGLCTPEKPSTPQLAVSNESSSPRVTPNNIISVASTPIANNNNKSSNSNNNNPPTSNSAPSTPRSSSIPRVSNIPAGTTPQQQQLNNSPSTGTATAVATTATGTGTAGGAAGAMSAPTGRQVPKRRMRRRATSQSQDPAEQLTEMSVRGLNLFRYASISEGVYQCTECAKVDIQKTFKNKYSFQRHAFLYHEGHQRKVFPCPVCGKEFSRPDKMKNHMKTVHDCFMPKDCVMPFGFYIPP